MPILTDHAPILILAATFTAVAAGPPVSETTIENTRQLQSTLSLDRDTYFPGEAGFFTVTVRNPGSTPLEVPDPFSAGSSCFAMRKLLEGGTSIPLSTQPVCPSRVVETGAQTTAILAGGDQRQTIVSSDTLALALDANATAPGPPVLNRPGYYQVEYVYHHLHPSVVFRVVAPHLDADTVVRLQDVTYTDPNTGKPVRLPAYLHVLALRWNSQTFICVSQFPDSGGKGVSADARGDFPGAGFPYVRIATSQEPIRFLNATVDANDRLSVLWLDTAGHWQVQSFASALPEPEPGGVQIGLDSTCEKLSPSEGRQFNATIIGSADTILKWTVALAPGAPASAQTGAVSASGKYSAPASITRPYQVILRARSQADTAKSAIAVVTLSPPKAAAAALSGIAAKPAPESVLPER